MKTIETKIQMRFTDTDLLGHVNNINLLNYFEVGKWEYLTGVLRLSPGWKEESCILKSTSATYEAQTRMGENLVVHTQVEKMGNKSITFSQRLFNKDTDETKAFCTSTLVAFNFIRQESIPIPEAWREAIGQQ